MRNSAEDHPHWLFRWISEHGIDSLERARRELASASTRELLAEAAAAYWSSPPEWEERTHDLVAGAGLSMSKPLSCPSAECRRDQIERLFRHAWHYFDTIALPDVASRLLLGNVSAQEDLEDLISFVGAMIHAVNLGAAELIRFTPPESQRPSFDETVQRVRDAHLLEPLASLIATIESSPDLETAEAEKGVFEYSYSIPDLHLTRRGRMYPRSKRRRKPPSVTQQRHFAALHVVSEYVASLEEDVARARTVGGAIGSPLRAYESLLSGGDSQALATVALHLELPTLENVAIEDLLRIRSAERESFLRFRGALERAMRERVKVSADVEARRVAAELVRDVVSPEVERLRRRLRHAETALKRKTAVALSLGGVATTCGLVAGLLPAAAISAGLLAAIAGISGGASKLIDERMELASSEYFFLWRASHGAHT